MGKRKTQEEFEKEMKLKNPRVKVIGIYVNAKTSIEVQCEKGHIWQASPGNLLRGSGCPHCLKNRLSLLQKNSKPMWETHPEIAMLLLNSEDGWRYPYSSNKTADFKCPVCGSIYSKTISLVSNAGHLYCPKCSDSSSYPNKFMFSLLTQLNIDFVNEYSPSWISPKSYDFYFEIDKNKYIIEMDGHFHKEDLKGSLSRIVKSDNYKNEKAKENGIEMIRIDCCYANISERFNYIKNNIIESRLSDIFILSKVDFEKCNCYGENYSFLKEVSDLWNSGNHNIESITNYFGYNNNDKVNKFLHRCAKFGMIPENDDEIGKIIKSQGLEVAKRKQKEIKRSKSTPVKCNETGEIFNSPRDAIDKYPTAKSIYNCLGYSKVKCNYAGRLPDGTKLSWATLSNKEYEEYLKAVI